MCVCVRVCATTSKSMYNTTIPDGHCECIIGFKPSTNNSACISVIVGDNCTSDPVCRMPNSACTNGVCQCNTGYKATADGLNCYQSESP